MKWLDTVIDVGSRLLKSLLGAFWWPLIRDTFQDAIGAYLVLSIGGYAGRLIAGKDFSSFAVCLKEWQTDPTSVAPYVCYGMVVLDFALWVTVLGRLLYRALLQIMPVPVRKHLRSRLEKLTQHQKKQTSQSAQHTGGGQHGSP